MKIDVKKLSFSKVTKLSEDLYFDPEVFKCYPPLFEVIKTHVDVSIQRFEEFIYVTIALCAKVKLQCSYSLEHFETQIKGNDELHFAPSDDEDEDCICYKGNIIDLDSYIFNLLSASVPIAPKSPNASAPKSGNGYRVLTEEEFEKEKQEIGNTKFDALKDLDL